MVRRSERGERRTCYAEIGIFYNAEADCIHITTPDLPDGHLRISKDPDLRWGHPRLYDVLARLLKQVGAPGPEVMDHVSNMTRLEIAAKLHEHGATLGFLASLSDDEIREMYRNVRRNPSAPIAENYPAQPDSN
jgi:hypothetical protein